MITKREQLAKLPDQLSKYCVKNKTIQTYSVVCLAYLLAILVDTIALFYQQIHRWIIRLLSPNMAHTFD